MIPEGCWKRLPIVPSPKAFVAWASSDSGGCQEIVELQSAARFQLPEPWSGQIDNAPILFISSNPSIDVNEEYPDESWPLDRTIDFFNNRFTSEAGWVKDGLHPLQSNGSHGKWVRFWAHARGRACEILEKEPNEIKPGIDFALTEVVHCKSRGERGVKKAQQCCSTRYLERILSLSTAKVIIVYGESAREAILSRFVCDPITAQLHKLCLVSIGGKSRMFVFLPHPNARGSKKTLLANFGNEGLAHIRAYLRASGEAPEG